MLARATCRPPRGFLLVGLRNAKWGRGQGLSHSVAPVLSMGEKGRLLGPDSFIHCTFCCLLVWGRNSGSWVNLMWNQHFQERELSSLYIVLYSHLPLCLWKPILEVAKVEYFAYFFLQKKISSLSNLICALHHGSTLGGSEKMQSYHNGQVSKKNLSM